MRPSVLSNIPFETVQQYTFKEEIANSVIHGLGALFSIVGLTVLLVLAKLYGTTTHVISYAIYGLSLITLYLASTLYHALPFLTAKKILKICDHAAIYLLIAGTYTPFLLVNLKGVWGYGLLITIWTLAIIGVVFKLFFTGRYRLASTLTYLLMGWLALVAARPLSEALPWTGILWIAAGGLAYTVGTLFYLSKKLPFHHAIWHAFVLAGSICHYAAVVDSSGLDF